MNSQIHRGAITGCLLVTRDTVGDGGGAGAVQMLIGYLQAVRNKPRGRDEEVGKNEDIDYGCLRFIKGHHENASQLSNS